MTRRPANLPKFSELPLNKGDLMSSAWVLYEKNDQLGFLNRQTDAIGAEAAKMEIKTGRINHYLHIYTYRISLNWPLDAQSKVPFFGRQVFHKQLIDKSPRTVNDDIWTFNTQRDGLRHFGYQKEKKFYIGVTMEYIHGSKDNTVNSIQAWDEKGIVGRGILLDFRRWASTNNISIEMFKKNSIPLKYLKAAARVAGDRDNVWRHTYHSRYMQAIKQLPDDELVRLAKRTPPELIGVEASLEMLE
ncbi:hypothetical protein PAAG_01491 [Paracoccidioides lutzii Pb01]|uniref:Uncharacterized protein n=1 Tax=Paracoccidioides lutzii (strain ATCC MYA-826 / Pb01) TaxID=502779 RepID=C1GSJ6_PARBA|nr:hypothetical protein PAAG_01491 [Paracoccidioides lutzii Pb01]EEH39029.2 hypothetical protein PAAG_01491 [Paracoccidioides lutzii Pb01]